MSNFKYIDAFYQKYKFGYNTGRSKKDLFKTFLWRNQKGKSVDIRTISKGYFKNLLPYLVKEYKLNKEDVEFLMSKRRNK